MPVGAPSSSATWSGPAPVHVSNPVPSRPMVQRGALDRSAGGLPVEEQAGEQLEEHLRLAVASHGAEHRRQRAVGSVTRSGDSVCGGRRPGASSAGWPASSENPMPRLCRKIPVPGTTTWQPQSAALDWMRDTPTPSASAAHR